ncbi:hypothetical protein MPTK1_Vg01110 [Marchantia polymorpha subsp. ruderalis]|uniref:Uncharacterized protein n=1 Tax=Marchantia polymorpha TaxID=3197 RepID=A0A2R6VX00_MARPO|nr:hypothetical protein MARPO_YA0011 [Marchantia polymorpha]BBN20653.1 hypothetical protein Mp_Vg01110 [Marchantia polymorpha subsp. ruderalis]|eukprot:PTQ26122.1 hypothetical protein MARPO_YA0011 [Marchantia polymorpha]
MYVLDVSDFIWSKIHQTGLKPRFGHTIWQHKQRFYTTGGFDGNSVAETSLHVLPCDNIKIDRLITNAQATLMLLHEYSSFDVAKNLFWSELECDIKLQNCHTLSYSKENIIVIKTDHHMLERFNVNQYDQVYQYWDIYMEASVENFLIKVLIWFSIFNEV